MGESGEGVKESALGLGGLGNSVGSGKKASAGRKRRGNESAVEIVPTGNAQQTEGKEKRKRTTKETKLTAITSKKTLGFEKNVTMASIRKRQLHAQDKLESLSKFPSADIFSEEEGNCSQTSVSSQESIKSDNLYYCDHGECDYQVRSLNKINQHKKMCPKMKSNNSQKRQRKSGMNSVKNTQNVKQTGNQKNDGMKTVLLESFDRMSSLMDARNTQLDSGAPSGSEAVVKACASASANSVSTKQVVKKKLNFCRPVSHDDSINGERQLIQTATHTTPVVSQKTSIIAKNQLIQSAGKITNPKRKRLKTTEKILVTTDMPDKGTKRKRTVSVPAIKMTEPSSKKSKSKHPQAKVPKMLHYDPNLHVDDCDDITSQPVQVVDSNNSDDLETNSSGYSLHYDPNLHVDDCDDIGPQSNHVKVSNYSDDLKLNLDTSGDSNNTDDLEDLPEVLTPKKKETLTFDENDILWVKVQRHPFWPAVVKKIYYDKKKKVQKISIYFIGELDEGHVFSLKYNKSTMVPFSTQHKEFVKAGLESIHKSKFEQAVQQAEDYVRKRALGTVDSNLNYFKSQESEIGIDESDDAQSENVECQPNSDVQSDVEDEEKEEDSSKFKEEHGSPEITLSQKTIESIERREIKAQQLVDFIKSEKTKEYLTKIYREEKPSERHKRFNNSDKERQKLKNHGMGPVTEVQWQEIISQLDSWFEDVVNPEKQSSKVYKTDYVMHVWFVEAMIFALIKVRKYSRKKAEEMFGKGMRLMKEERCLEHSQIIESGKLIDKDAKELYGERLQLHIQNLT